MGIATQTPQTLISKINIFLLSMKITERKVSTNLLIHTLALTQIRETHNIYFRQ